MVRLDDHDYADEVSERIDAPAERVYDLVSDLPAMGRFSPENRGGRWLRGGGPVAGARFLGLNRRGPVAWVTVSRVVTADRPNEFTFDVASSGARWSYRLRRDGEATVVTETRTPFRKRPMVARVFAAGLLGGVGDHDREMRDGMAATLARIKAAAERV